MKKRRYLIKGLSALSLLAFKKQAFSTSHKKHLSLHKKISAQRTSLPIKKHSPIIQAKAAYLIDAISGNIIVNKNGYIPIKPFSMTKLLTAYSLFSMLKKKYFNLKQTFPISTKAWKMQGDKTFFELGANVTIDDLLKGMIVQSGNDAVIALAEGAAGSEKEFVKIMNHTAQQIGMKNSYFVNATGIAATKQITTPHDIALLSKRLIDNFPEYYHYFHLKKFTYNDISQTNTNKLVLNGYADGLTMTEDDIHHFSGCISKNAQNGQKYILILISASSLKNFIYQTEKLLSFSISSSLPLNHLSTEPSSLPNNFSHNNIVTIFNFGQIIKKNVPVQLGEQNTVSLITKESLSLPMPEDWRNKVKFKLNLKAPLSAPLIKGKTYASMSLLYDNHIIKTIDLTVSNSIAQINPFSLFIRRL